MKLTNYRAVVLGALFWFVLAGLFPPWAGFNANGHYIQVAHYSFLFSPPVDDSLCIRLDADRLCLEWVLIVAIAFAVSLVSRKKV